MQPRTLILAVGALAVACADPVHDRDVEALGPEVSGVPKGPHHRPGQPCLTCHGGDGPADLVMSFGGTVYSAKTSSKTVSDVVVRVLDAEQRTYEVSTNAVGNFWIPADRFSPIFPVNAAVTSGQNSRVMRTAMRLDGSCNGCHGSTESVGSPGRVWVSPGSGGVSLNGRAGIFPPCPTDAVVCPDSVPPPTYANDVAPILEANCTGCHGPGGENEDVPLTTYRFLMTRQGTSHRAQTALAEVLNCNMPPAPLPRLSAEGTATLYCWFAGGEQP